MRIPGLAVAALLAHRETSSTSGLLPEDYCVPECPSCKANYLAFNYTADCVPASPFITNCGSCQQCVIEYALTNGQQNTSNALEVFMASTLNLCADSPIAAQVSGYQDQASRISSLGDLLATVTATATATTITSTPEYQSLVSAVARCKTEASIDASCSSVLASASWASEMYALKTTATTTNTALPATLTSPTGTTFQTSTIPTSTSTSTSSPSAVPAHAAPLNPIWIAGPVVGSVLGILTVVIVIYFTRRKQAQANAAAHTLPPPPPKEINDDESLSASTIQGKAQLHSDCVVINQLDSHEVYEMPAREPVGSELQTPRDEKDDGTGEWSIPVSPLPYMFAMTELRDQRTGGDASPRHDTFYHA